MQAQGSEALAIHRLHELHPVVRATAAGNFENFAFEALRGGEIAEKDQAAIGVGFEARFERDLDL